MLRPLEGRQKVNVNVINSSQILDPGPPKVSKLS